MCVISRVNSIEQQIKAGLLEEIIEVAESELHLAKVMLENQAYVYLFSSDYNHQKPHANTQQVGRTSRQARRRSMGLLRTRQGHRHDAETCTVEVCLSLRVHPIPLEPISFRVVGRCSNRFSIK